MLQEATTAMLLRLSDGLVVSGVSVHEFDVLIRLYREPSGRVSMTRVAVNAGLTPAGFTRLADRMTDAGLLLREPSRADRRVVYVALTDRGRELTAHILQRHTRDLEQALGGVLTAEQIRTLTDLTRRLRDAHLDVNH